MQYLYHGIGSAGKHVDPIYAACLQTSVSQAYFDMLQNIAHSFEQI
jgi:hypothetical protein